MPSSHVQVWHVLSGHHMADFKDEKEMGVSSVMVHFIYGHSPHDDTWNGGSILPITLYNRKHNDTATPPACLSWMPGAHSRQSLKVTTWCLPTSTWRGWLLWLNHVKPHKNGVRKATQKSNPFIIWDVSVRSHGTWSPLSAALSAIQLNTNAPAFRGSFPVSFCAWC